MESLSIQEIVDSNRLLCPSMFSRFIQETIELTPCKLIQEKTDDTKCSVPIICKNMTDNEPIFFADKKKERLKFTFNYLKDKEEYVNLYKYITNPNTKLLGISTNKIYIQKAILSNKNNKGYCPPQLKNKENGWMLLIDNQSKLLGFIVLDII